MTTQPQQAYIVTKYRGPDVAEIEAQWTLPHFPGADFRFRSLKAIGAYTDMRCSISGAILQTNLPVTSMIEEHKRQLRAYWRERL